MQAECSDAPEAGQPDGKAAKAALSPLIFGKAVEVDPFEQDRYDRLVAPWAWRQRKSRAGDFTDYSRETVATCVAALGH